MIATVPEFAEEYEALIQFLYGAPVGLARTLSHASFCLSSRSCATCCVLRHLAAALTATFRDVDVIVRLGGKVFAVLLPSTGLEGAATVAERLRLAGASQLVEVDGVAIRYTVSAGVAATDDHSMGLDALMKQAGIDLCAAKAAGRDRIKDWSSWLEASTGISGPHHAE